MNHIRISFFLVFVTILSLLLGACNASNGTNNPKDALSAFIRGDEKITIFGHMNLEDFLTKVDYKNIPTFGGIIDGQKKEWEQSLDFSQPIYYAVEGQINHRGEPNALYGFVKLKNKQLLIDNMTEDGFDFNEINGIAYTQDGVMIVGATEDIAILIFKPNVENVEDEVKKSFKKIRGEKSGGRVDEVLENEGDIVLGMSVTSIYQSSENNFGDLTEGKRKELETILKDSYIQTVFKFEEGAAIIQTKNLFSASLEERMFLKSDDKAKIITFLGKGSPRIGFSVNIDIAKMNDLINEFSPEAISELAKSIGPQAQIALMFSGKDGLSAFLDGRMGAVYYGDFVQDKQIDFNAFIGLTEKGKELVNDFIGDNMKYAMTKILLENDGLFMSSNESLMNRSMTKDLKLPQGCEDFGKSAISFYLNLEGVNMDNLDLKDGENVLRAIHYMRFDYDNDGGVFYIKAKKGQENILKQTMDELVKVFSDDIRKSTFQ